MSPCSSVSLPRAFSPTQLVAKALVWAVLTLRPSFLSSSSSSSSDWSVWTEGEMRGVSLSPQLPLWIPSKPEPVRFIGTRAGNGQLSPSQTASGSPWLISPVSSFIHSPLICKCLFAYLILKGKLLSFFPNLGPIFIYFSVYMSEAYNSF